MMTPTIELYEIIILVNYVWAHSFFCPIRNATDIVHQGWNLLNRKLLLDETLRYTITETEKTNECGNAIIIPNHNIPILTSTTTAATVVNSTASAASSISLPTTSTTLTTYKAPSPTTILHI